MDVVTTHYGHWRGILRIAAELASTTNRLQDVRLGTQSSAIILARTSLETYLNEGWFSLAGKSAIEPAYKRFVDMTVVDRYRHFLDLNHVLLDSECDKICTDISVVNQIRNFCIHYTGPTIKQKTHSEIKKRPELHQLLKQAGDTPQSYLINEHSSRFCLISVANAIVFVERMRSEKTPLSRDFIEFCEEFIV